MSTPIFFLNLKIKKTDLFENVWYFSLAEFSVVEVKDGCGEDDGDDSHDDIKL